MKTYRRSRGTAPPILNVPGNITGTHLTGDWVGPKAAPDVFTLHRSVNAILAQIKNCRLELVQSSWNVMAHGDARGGEVKGKLANGVGSQCSSHYLGTWCIQHYYRWCAHLGCQQSTELTPPGRFKWTRLFRRKMKSGFCACAITFQTQSTTWWWPTGRPKHVVVNCYVSTSS